MGVSLFAALKRTVPHLRPLLRRSGRRAFRFAWHSLRTLGIGVPAEWLLRSPLDLKVGRHFLDAGTGRRVLAVCDLACIPVAYDIVRFLTVADNFRRRKGARWLDVALIAHDSDPFVDGVDQSDPVMQGEYRTVVHNLGVRATL